MSIFECSRDMEHYTASRMILLSLARVLLLAMIALKDAHFQRASFNLIELRRDRSVNVQEITNDKINGDQPILQSCSSMAEQFVVHAFIGAAPALRRRPAKS
jgi:hypothetical protein